jgi:hypothetical protein
LGQQREAREQERDYGPMHDSFSVVLLAKYNLLTPQNTPYWKY